MDKKIKWYILGFMAFSPVWSFGNVINGFVYFNGQPVIFSWILMFALYFIPYVLMVGELGSAFKTESGGVSSWIYRTKGERAAYFAGFTYWACHVTYIVSKSSAFLKAVSWAIFRNAETYDSFPILPIQLATLAVLLISCFMAAKGINPLRSLLSLAGTCIFVMSILYIILTLAAPLLHPNTEYIKAPIRLKNLIPSFDVSYFTQLSILVFAVGGCEKISPYVNKVENPSKGFPKGMITLTIMVSVCAIFGSIAMGRMFDPAVINVSQESFDSYAANGQYIAFQKLGQYYGIGDFFMIIYAICNAIATFAVLVLSIDAPLRMLLDNENTRQFIPARLQKVNSHGAYINGILLMGILSGIIIVLQSFGAGAATVLRQLTKLNSVCMPLRYLWVFIAYIALRKSRTDITPEYRFVKKRGPAVFFGIWCFSITAVCCLLGMYDKDPLTFALNLATPCVLLALGLIMPRIAAREHRNCSKYL